MYNESLSSLYKSKQMNKKERFYRVLKREKLDRLPVQLDFSPKALDKVAKNWGIDNKEEELLDFLGNHIVYAYMDDVYNKIKIRENFDKRILYDEWGIGWDTQQEGLFIADHPLDNIENYQHYKFPELDKKDLFKSAKKKIEKYSNDYIVCSYHVLCLFERAWSLRGLENFMIDMMSRSNFVNDLLDRITGYQIKVAEKYVELGVTCARTGDDYGGQSSMLFSPELWRKLFKPRLEKIWDVYKKADIPVILHSCGNVEPIIPDLIEMGLDVLHPLQPEAMSVEELSQKYGKDLSFYGGLSIQKVLPLGSPEDVKEDVKKCIEVLGKNNGYIIGPANSITSDVPLKNIEALISSIDKYNV